MTLLLLLLLNATEEEPEDEDEICVVTTIGLDLDDDVVVELTVEMVVHDGSETVLLKSYKFNLPAPPQNSD